MNLKRVKATSVSEGQRLISQKFGMDVVILRTKELESGVVEFLIGIENDESSSAQSKSQPVAAPQQRAPEHKPQVKAPIVQDSNSVNEMIARRSNRMASLVEQTREGLHTNESLGGAKKDLLSALANRTKKDEDEESEYLGATAAREIAERLSAMEARSAPKKQSQAPAVDEQAKSELIKSQEENRRLANEMSAMRQMMHEQLQMLKWRDQVKSNPVKGETWGLLNRLGFSPLFARKVVERLPDGITLEQSIGWLQRVLAHNLTLRDPKENMIEQGGVFALVGPTGVGKTTTTAKLAARCVMKYGVDSIGLITTDSYRIGAQDQLRIYGKILNVPVYTAQTDAELLQIRNSMQRKHLIIIDTVGMAQRDTRILKQTEMLKASKVKRVLLLNASSQPQTLNDVVTHYKQNGLDSCILSKLDESLCLGGALDVVIRNKLPIHYLATGQRVPEDLFLPDAMKLVKKTLSLKFSSTYEETEEEAQWKLNQSHKD